MDDSKSSREGRTVASITFGRSDKIAAGLIGQNSEVGVLQTEVEPYSST
jgi:hypothetical protein